MSDTMDELKLQAVYVTEHVNAALKRYYGNNYKSGGDTYKDSFLKEGQRGEKGDYVIHHDEPKLALFMVPKRCAITGSNVTVPKRCAITGSQVTEDHGRMTFDKENAEATGRNACAVIVMSGVLDVRGNYDHTQFGYSDAGTILYMHVRNVLLNEVDKNKCAGSMIERVKRIFKKIDVRYPSAETRNTSLLFFQNGFTTSEYTFALSPENVSTQQSTQQKGNVDISWSYEQRMQASNTLENYQFLKEIINAREEDTEDTEYLEALKKLPMSLKDLKQLYEAGEQNMEEEAEEEAEQEQPVKRGRGRPPKRAANGAAAAAANLL